MGHCCSRIVAQVRIPARVSIVLFFLAASCFAIADYTAETAAVIGEACSPRAQSALRDVRKRLQSAGDQISRRDIRALVYGAPQGAIMERSAIKGKLSPKQGLVFSRCLSGVVSSDPDIRRERVDELEALSAKIDGGEGPDLYDAYDAFGQLVCSLAYATSSLSRFLSGESSECYAVALR